MYNEIKTHVSSIYIAYSYSLYFCCTQQKKVYTFICLKTVVWCFGSNAQSRSIKDFL